jgi:ParB family chromosome partitioning protein
MTNDDATIAMVNANMQREEILPSERAFAYKMKLDAIKHQGVKRTSPQVGVKLQAADIVGESTGVSGSQVSRYIRLTELIPKLLDMVDEGRLAISCAVEISFLNHTYQQWVWEYIHENGMIKQEQLMDLRQYRDDDSLTQEQMIDILIQKRATPQIKKKVTFNERKLNKYFPAYYSQSEIERIMISLLEEWKRTHESEDT